MRLLRQAVSLRSIKRAGPPDQRRSTLSVAARNTNSGSTAAARSLPLNSLRSGAERFLFSRTPGRLPLAWPPRCNYSLRDTIRALLPVGFRILARTRNLGACLCSTTPFSPHRRRTSFRRPCPSGAGGGRNHAAHRQCTDRPSSIRLGTHPIHEHSLSGESDARDC